MEKTNNRASQTGYDLIGDIHGHAGPLRRLLGRLGYHEAEGRFSHPERKVIFLGDFIDRGPQVEETLRMVKAMVDNGAALAVMGNHEYNAICYHTRDAQGNPLRKHSEKNQLQHQATLKAFEHAEKEWAAYLAWFRTLPLYLELPGLRVIHACWSEAHLNMIGRQRVLTETLLHQSAVPGSPEYLAIETLLKGLELKLPAGQTAPDEDGTLRDTIRVTWWVAPAAQTYRQLLYPENPKSYPALDVPVPESELRRLATYRSDLPPLFIGHYWLRPGSAKLPAPNIACIDYSVAKTGGQLVAYRWDGEQLLDPNKFVAEGRD